MTRANHPRQTCCARIPLLLVLAALLAAAPLPDSQALAQRVVVMVNGEPVTTRDIEHRSKLIQLTTRKTASQQEVINQLIDDKLKVQEAAKFKLVPSESDIENTFRNMASRMGLSAQQLEQNLASQGASAASLKSRIRADLVWGQLVRGRFQSSLQIGEREIIGALQAKQKEDSRSFEHTLRPILLIVPRGSPPGTYDARRREAEALRGRFQSCDTGLKLARGLRDSAVRPPMIRAAADLPEPLREMLNKMQVGQVTPPEQTAQGIEIFALCGKRESAADSPGRREAREEIFNERFKAQSDRYLKQIKRGAMIEYR